MPPTPTAATQIRFLDATGFTARPFARLSPNTVFFGLNSTLGSSLTVAPRFCVTVAAKSSKAGEQKWTHEGSVTESLPNGMFRVRLDNQDVIIGYISGKIRKNHVRILPGDRVKVEVSRYDSSRGRIVYRLQQRVEQ